MLNFESAVESSFEEWIFIEGYVNGMNMESVDVEKDWYVWLKLEWCLSIHQSKQRDHDNYEDGPESVGCVKSECRAWIL